MSIVNWKADAGTEELLKELGVKWKRKRIRLADIDRKASLKNNARIGEAISEDHVQDIGVSMESGNRIAACISHLVKGKQFIDAGNHRVEATDLVGDTDVMSYVIDTQDEEILDRIRVRTNRDHGLKLRQVDAMSKAVDFVKIHGMTQQEAATQCGVKSSVLQDHMRADEMKDTLDACGVDPNGISRAVLLKLRPLKNARPVLAKAGELAIKRNLNGPQVAEMVKMTKAARSSELQKIAAVAKYEEQLDKDAVKVVGGVTRSRRTKLLTHFHTFRNNVLSVKSLRRAQVSDPQDIKMIAKEWREVKTHMDLLLREARNGA